MERSTYRGTSRGTTRSASRSRRYAVEEKNDIGETIVLQCIVSGIILACLLGICLIKTDFTTGIRQDLKEAISGHTSISDTTGAAQDVLTMIVNAVGFLQPSDDIQTNQTPETLQTPGASQIPEADKSISSGIIDSSVADTSDFRIDEDILRDINARVDPYGADEKKLIVPDTSPAPEQK